MDRTLIGQRMGLIGILITTAGLIGLTWFGTLGGIRNQRTDAEARIQASITTQAMVFAGQVEVHLLEVDQTLRTLAHAWQADPQHFRLLPWHEQLVLLKQISTDVFIADEHGIVRDATVPEAIGRDVGDRDYFRALAAQHADDSNMFISATTLGPLVQQWHMDLARPLHRQDGSFAGVIVTGLRTGPIGDFYHVANVGSHGMIAIVGLGQGNLRLAAGPDRVDPGTGIAHSNMFKAMQADPDSVWSGRSAPDDIQRVHAFRRIGDRDLGVVVAVDRDEAMRATQTWITEAYAFAAGITGLLLLLGAILIFAMRSAQRREDALSHERAVLASANTELGLAKTRADAKTIQLEATLAGMTDGLAVVDGDMRLVEWNRRFAEIASVPIEILHVGLPIEEILRAQARAGVFGEVDIEAEVAQRAAVLRTLTYPGTVERTAPDGRVVELRRNVLPDGGFVTLYTDITQRRESVSALRQANALAEAATKAMSRFVAIVSHEIRTPLNALLNSLGLLADSGMQTTQQALLEVAQRSGDALLGLVNDILEMSRMEAGQLTLRPSIFALRPLIASAIEMFSAQASQRRIALRMSVAEGVPDEMYEDPGRLRQVLINLLSNAVKFAAPGEVRVTAELLHTREGQHIRLAVRDRGPVIRDENRAFLFEPFSQLENGDVAPVGTGLGLAICRHLVALMGGEIGCSVWTIGGRSAGNEFWLTLPIKPMLAELSAPAARTDAPSRPWLPRTRILLVEDIVANQVVTGMLLRREGHLVDIADDGAAAIGMLERQPYDLVLMDVFMPGISGLDTARRIRSMTGPAAIVPIVALTANVGPEDQAICIEAGMNGMLGKPVTLRELLGVIGRQVWPHRPDRMPAPPNATSTTASSTVLSSARVNELRSTLAAPVLANLVEECLIDLSDRMASLHDALDRGDTRQITENAHAMAGMAAEYGMAALEARLRVFMLAAKDGADIADALVEQLDIEISRSSAALRQMIQIEMA